MSDFWLFAGRFALIAAAAASERALGQQFGNSPANRTHSTPQASDACGAIRPCGRTLCWHLFHRAAVEFKNKVVRDRIAHVLHAVHFARRVVDGAEWLNPLPQSFNLTR
jgi:hypothetical protein